MRVTEITVTMGKTISLGDFQFGRADFTTKATLDEPLEPGSAEFRAAFKELSARTNKAMLRSLAEIYPETQA